MPVKFVEQDPKVVAINLRTVWHDRSLNHGAQQFCTPLKSQTLETATDSIDQAKPGSLVREFRVNFVIQDIVGNVLDDLIRFGSNGGFCVRGHAP